MRILLMIDTDALAHHEVLFRAGIGVDEPLRIAVDDGEPGALDLNHHPMAGQEGMRHIG